jgi:hypothetical protein
MKSVIGVSALSIITILGKSLASGLHSLFDGFIPNYDNDTNPLAKTGYDDVGSFAAPIVSLELLLETIPKVDAKPFLEIKPQKPSPS